MIVLLTDFGTQDIYVGVMKGVIETIAPGTPVIDLTHEIATQDIDAGSFALASALPYFPHGSIFVAVIDPGVGTSRRPIAVLCEGRIIVCPDNGLLSDLSRRFAISNAIVLDKPRFYFSERPSRTFHGRDVFAPAAAHLASGADLHVSERNSRRMLWFCCRRARSRSHRILWKPWSSR